MHTVFERGLIEFVRPGGTKKWIVIRELHQDFVEDVIMHDTLISCVNGMKYF